MFMEGVESIMISIPDGVHELSDEFFSKWKSLSRVTFCGCSSLNLIGKGTFSYSGLCEIHIPDGVEELCESCFYDCASLSRVTFCESSSLKSICE